MAEKKVTAQYLEDLEAGMQLFKAFIQQMMYAPEDALPMMQKKAITIGSTMLGIPYNGNAVLYEEGQVIGNIKITGKIIKENEILYNIAELDVDGDVVRGTQKQGLTEEELEKKINEANETEVTEVTV